MKSTIVRLLFAAGAVVLAATGCGTSTGDDGDSDSSEGSGTSGVNALAEEMRSWDACEVLDDMQPVWDYMQIEGVQSGDTLNSSGWGEGMDAQAASCNGLVTVSSWTRLDGSNRVNDGELWASIVPWENEEQAIESYEERTGPDIEELLRQSSTLEETDRIDLGSEWDKGELIVLESSETGISLNIVAREGQWMIHMEVNYSNDSGEKYFYDNEHRMDGQTIEDFAYPFEDEALRQWLVEEYLPSVHQTITSRIGEE